MANRILTVALAATILAAGCDEDTTGDSGSVQDSEDARLSVLLHASCFPTGLDKISAGDVDAGREDWASCFAEDYEFSLDFGFGDPIVCTAEDCAPEGETSIDKRIGVGLGIYNSAGFVGTHHTLDNPDVTLQSETEATFASKLTSVHWTADGTVVIGYGTWTAEMSRSEDGEWRIVEETIVSLGPPSGA